jgi:beta-glucuronidase
MDFPFRGAAALLRPVFRHLGLALAACLALQAPAQAQTRAPAQPQSANAVDVQLAGQPASARAGSLMAPLQNIAGRSHISLNGRWSYIIDP